MLMRLNAVDLITQIKRHLESLTLLGTSILNILQSMLALAKNSIVFLTQQHP